MQLNAATSSQISEPQVAVPSGFTSFWGIFLQNVKAYMVFIKFELCT